MAKENLLRLVVKYIKILVGSAIYSAGFSFFMYPNSIVTGGITGIAMILNYVSELPVGVLTIIMNIPLFAIAWKKFGLPFMIASLAGMLSSAILVDVFEVFGIVATSDTLLACVYGGVIKGFGLGLVFSANATTGGVDIIAKFLKQRYPHVNFGTLVLGLDAAVIVGYAIISQKYDSAMFAIIAMYITSKIIDLVLYGASSCKVCHVISENSVDIKQAITGTLGRGCTIIRGEGAYSGKEKQVILCVIKNNQIVELRKLVREIDENAFIIVSDSREVFGKGFLSIYSSN